MSDFDVLTPRISKHNTVSQKGKSINMVVINPKTWYSSLPLTKQIGGRGRLEFNIPLSSI